MQGWGAWLQSATQSATEALGATDLVEKAKAAAMDVADAANKAADAAKAEYQRTFVDLDCQIYPVREELRVMEFPAHDKIDRLATRLNTDYPHRMLIYNMSEQKYDAGKFCGEVVDVAFRGLPAPPMDLLMELCLSGHNWLVSDPGNILVVHCFQGYSRSIVFLSCFIAFRGLSNHPVDALHQVCERLGMSDASAISPSQRRYLSYFQQCQQGFSPKSARLRLLRAQLNGVPLFESEGSVAFRPYIEVWNHGDLIYTSLGTVNPGGGGSATAEDGALLPAGFSASDPCVSFLFPCIYVAGDVLIRVRHVCENGRRDTAFRLAFHTGFVPEGLQLPKHELDSACDDSRFSEEFFLDLIFEPADEEPAEVPPVFDKARELSKKLWEEEQRRQEAAAKEASASIKRDVEAELEETLLRGSGSGAAKVSVGGTAATSGAAELRAALAAAAADDSPVASAASQPKAATSTSASPGGPSVREEANGEGGALPPASAGASAAHPPAESAEEVLKGSQNDIDDLFSDFDAALASVAGGKDSDSTKGKAEAPSAAKADATESSKPAEAPKKGDSGDVFADVDAFLKELDGP